MTQPTPYDRQANFANEEALNPTGKTPGVSLDSEFNAAKLTLDEILNNLAMIQRDDGALKNGIVTSDSLSPALSIGFTLQGPWTSGVNYVLNDGVTQGSKFYRATSSHLSAPSTAPGQVGAPWQQVADFDAAAAAAGVAAGAAATAATQAAIAQGLIGGALTAAVRWDAPQALTTPQKAQARSNIDAVSTGRNLLINASFRINQRAFAGGALAAGIYGHDRWKAAAGGANYSVSGGVATISSGSIVQVIEGASIEFTETHVINWTGTATCTVDGVARAKGDTFTLTAGTNATIAFSGGTVSMPQVEAGSVATLFERRPVGYDLQLCQRYFEKFAVGEVIGAGYALNSTTAFVALVFKAPKRVSATVTFPSAVGSYGIETSGGLYLAVSTPVASSQATSGVLISQAEIQIVTSASLTTNQAVLGRLVGSGPAEILVSAEL